MSVTLTVALISALSGILIGRLWAIWQLKPTSHTIKRVEILLHKLEDAVDQHSYRSGHYHILAGVGMFIVCILCLGIVSDRPLQATASAKIAAKQLDEFDARFSALKDNPERKTIRWFCVHQLPEHKNDVIPILEQLAKQPGLAGVDARDALYRWSKK